jgi:hypothetical protein
MFAAVEVRHCDKCCRVNHKEDAAIGSHEPDDLEKKNEILLRALTFSEWC